MDFSTFQGDPEALKWAQWDLKNLHRALDLTPGRKCVVQAGGNLGVFAAVLAEHFEMVHTFEPDERLFKLLKQNVSAPNVQAENSALGARSGSRSITKPDGGHDGETYLIEDGDETSKNYTPVTALDGQAFESLDLLYLDIEGYELFALEGARETIRHHRPVVVVEINKCCHRYGYTRTDIDAFMVELGYVERERVHNDVIYTPDTPLNLVCVRVGDKYGPEYVSTLFDMLLRNLSTHVGKIALWCITDDPESLPPEVTAIPFNPMLPGWWQKVMLFSPRMPWEDRAPVVYFDLDVAITGRLEDLVQTHGIIRDWSWMTYNSSVMSWAHGDHRNIWADFDPESMFKPGPLVEAAALPVGQVNGGDQEWITQCGPWPVFPAAWCRSYRDSHDWPPKDCKVVVLHGSPKPHEVTTGWLPDVWKPGGFTSLPEMKGVNVSHEALWDNIAVNIERDLPWFTGDLPHKQTAVLVCGGPSLKDSVQVIKDHKRRGAKIVTVNNTLTWALSHGIVPDCHVMLDARAENVEFVRAAPKGVRYFLASQAHPSVFDALADRNVSLWHNAVDGGKVERLAKARATDKNPVVPVPGGGTVGLRCMFLLYMSGYRKLHIYGMDGSYEDGRHHAYEQTLNDGEHILNVVLNGKHYACSKWMARQATEFQQHWIALVEQGMKISTHGRGLIPDMAKALQQQIKEAKCTTQ